MDVALFDFDLPEERIAQKPLEDRAGSRLMKIDRKSGEIGDGIFSELVDLLGENDVLVFNDSRVIPARILFSVGGKEAEIFLLKKKGGMIWECLVRPGKNFKVGAVVVVDENLRAEVLEDLGGTRLIRFECEVGEGEEYLESVGSVPLPPYIKDRSADFERYQTVYSRDEGSAAAPTAGLHFTEGLLGKLRDKGVALEFVTLHVGLGTFAPVKADDTGDHVMHSEVYSLPGDVAERLNDYKLKGKRIIAVGTTAVRVLETCAGEDGILRAGGGETEIFIEPGYEWKFVDGLVTNFHLPKSTLIMLVSAFAGRDLVMRAYEEAVKMEYRFYSFGDAMIIL